MRNARLPLYRAVLVFICLGALSIERSSATPPPNSTASNEVKFISTTFPTKEEFRLKVQGPIGNQVAVEASTDLIHWVPLRTDLFLNNRAEVRDDDASFFPRRFYRATSSPAQNVEQVIPASTGGTISLSINGSSAVFAPGTFATDRTVNFWMRPLDFATESVFSETTLIFEPGPRGDVAVIDSGSSAPAKEISVRLKLSDSFRQALGAGFRPELFVQAFSRNEEETIDYFELVDSAFTPDTSELSASVPLWAFTSFRNPAGTYQCVLLIGSLPAVSAAGLRSYGTIAMANVGDTECAGDFFSPLGGLTRDQVLQTVSSEAGERTDPLNAGELQNHAGIDFSLLRYRTMMGDRTAPPPDLVPVADGSVIHVGWVHQLGQVVIVQHNGFQTLYAHLAGGSLRLRDANGVEVSYPKPQTADENYPPTERNRWVSFPPGQIPVTGGLTPIGVLGNTGSRSSGAHLHMEYSRKDILSLLGKTRKGRLNSLPCISAQAPVPSTLSIDMDDAVVTEGNAGSVNAVFAAHLSASSSNTITVDFHTIDGAAVAGQDYLSATGKITFPPGTTNQSVSVTVSGDLAVEPDETFFIGLSNPVNAVLGRTQAIGLIVNDDRAFPTIKIGNASVKEGDSGAVRAIFPVSLSASSPVNVTIDYQTQDGTANAGADYVAAKSSLTIPSGMTNATIEVLVLGDTITEENETFLVTLSNPVNVTILRGTQGLGTILDDDDLPPFIITTTSLPSASNGGTLLKPYFASVLATGGIPPCLWSATGLPTGFNLQPLQSGGIVICDEVDISGFAGNGQPAAGNYSVVITGVDSRGRTAKATLTLSVLNEPTKFTLTVNKAGTGAGNVTLNPAGGSYTANTVVTLTAAPEAGSLFAGWSGDASGAALSVSLTMNANKSVTATFSKASNTSHWSGGWTITAPNLCAGATGTWSATIINNNGVLSGTWQTDFGDSGTISGSLSSVTFGSTSGARFSGVITGDTISGTFVGDECTGNNDPTRGNFSGKKDG